MSAYRRSTPTVEDSSIVVVEISGSCAHCWIPVRRATGGAAGGAARGAAGTVPEQRAQGALRPAPAARVNPG